MQALEFSNALKEIIEELRVNQLIELLEPLMRIGNNVNVSEPVKQQFLQLLFDANAGYRQLKTKQATRKVVEAYAIGELLEPARLASMVAVVQTVGQTQNIWNNQTNFQNFYTFLALLHWLRRSQRATQELLESEKVGSISDSEGVVELQLIEYAGEVGISPERLQKFIFNVDELYTVVSIVLQKPNQFTFRYLDSGSNFLAGIVSAKDIAEVVNRLVDQWFERLRFWKYDKFDKDLETVSKTIDLAAKVHQQVQGGAITPEDGQILTTRALNALDALTGIGVTPATRGTEITIERQQFLNEARKTKLLKGTTTEEGDIPLPEIDEPPSDSGSNA